jgi:DNA-binding CsgD family transcriptional regulator
MTLKNKLSREEPEISAAEYRLLFEDCPVSLWVEDFSEVKDCLDRLRGEGVSNLDRYFDDHPEALIRCASLVRINYVNKATLAMYQAKSIEDLRKGLDRIFNQESYVTFKKELIALAADQTSFQTEAVTQSLKGKKNYINLKWSTVSVRGKPFSRVLVSIIDLTSHRRLEERLEKHEQQLEALVEERTGDLRERMKELKCLYGVSQLLEKEGDSIDDILRGVVDLMPAAYRYPEIVSARILFRDREFTTERFKSTRWKQAAEILVGGKKAGRLEVCYLEIRPQMRRKPFLKEEKMLIKSVATRLGIIIERCQAVERLKESAKRLSKQKKALEEKNIALREIMGQLGIEKQVIKNNIRSRVENSVLPSVKKLRRLEAAPVNHHLDILERNLQQITSPFGLRISEPQLELTPREIEICELVKSGFPNKEIARDLNLSPGTVEKHRENIRKKLGITHRKINLRSFLLNL